MLLAFQHPLAIFELKTSSQIFIFGLRVFVGAVRQDNFCACKQYLLTENLSDEGLGRIFWIADIPMSSPPILSDLCPPSLRLCPSMPSKSQVKSIIVLSVSTSKVHHPPSVKLKSIFSHPTRLQPPRSVLWNLIPLFLLVYCTISSNICRKHVNLFHDWTKNCSFSHMRWICQTEIYHQKIQV